MKVNEVVKELRALSTEESTGSLEKPYRIRELRKNVARMKTILKERENGGEK